MRNSCKSWPAKIIVIASLLALPVFSGCGGDDEEELTAPTTPFRRYRHGGFRHPD